MSQNLDEYNAKLLPYICVRCEREYFATKRDMVSYPELLCVGCYTRLLLGPLDAETDDIADLARHIRLVNVLTDVVEWDGPAGTLPADLLE